MIKGKKTSQKIFILVPNRYKQTCKKEMTIGLQLCRWYYQAIGAWKCVSAYFVYFHQFFSLFLTYSLSKTLKKWMTLNKVLLVHVIHMTKQFWDKIGRFDADKYAGNVLKLECYKLVHAVIIAIYDKSPEIGL